MDACCAPILPVAWVLAHATVPLMEALDPRYIDQAQWIVDVILKTAASPRSVVGRSGDATVAYTHQQHAAHKVLYGFLVPIYMALILGVLRLFRWAVTGRS
jgi:hypothetical protein